MRERATLPPSETCKVFGRPLLYELAARCDERVQMPAVLPVVHDANFSWWPDAKVFTCALPHRSRFHFLSIHRAKPTTDSRNMNSVCSDIGQLEFGDEFSSSDDDTTGRFVYVFNFWSEKGLLKGKPWELWDLKSTIVISLCQSKIGVCHSKGEKYLLLVLVIRDDSSGKSLYFSHSFLMVVRRQDQIFNQA